MYTNLCITSLSNTLCATNCGVVYFEGKTYFSAHESSDSDADTVADATAEVFQRVNIGGDKQAGFHIYSSSIILSNCRATSFANECHRDHRKRI